MAVLVRGDLDASRLRGLAKKTKDGPKARRLLALAAIYDGAIDLETGQTRMIEALTIDAASTIRLLQSIEAFYPMLERHANRQVLSAIPGRHSCPGVTWLRIKVTDSFFLSSDRRHVLKRSGLRHLRCARCIECRRVTYDPATVQPRSRLRSSASTMPWRTRIWR